MTKRQHVSWKRTLVYPMIGHPIAQVKSPATFNRYFEERRMDAVMIPVDILPSEVAHFFSFLRGWRNCPAALSRSRINRRAPGRWTNSPSCT